MTMLIKGVKPPKSCYVCGWYNKVDCPVHDGKCYYRNERHPSCPLIELPPHGRLIDADKIDFRNYAMHDGKGNLIVDNNFVNGIVWANDCIDMTPTVIEGSET